jgi:hypothetical protein
VDDAGSVRSGKRRSDLAGDRQGARRLDRSALDHCAQALAGHVVQHQVEGAVVQTAEVLGGNDVRVLDARGCDRLPLEARHDLLVVGHLAVQHFDREALAHVDVLGQVDHAHPTLAEPFFDAVAIGDHLPDAGVFGRLGHLERLSSRRGRAANSASADGKSGS